MTTIFLSGATDAVDAVLVTKRDAVLTYAKDQCLELSKIAAIGDSVNDLPFLEIEGLGLIGAPNNAQQRVKDFVIQKPHGVVLEKNVLSGFCDFYRKAKEKGIQTIFADRDGVLIWKDLKKEDIVPLKEMLLKSTPKKGPNVFVLTGSSFDQNTRFISEYNLNDENVFSPEIKKNPYIILAENGCLHISVKDNQTKLSSSIKNTSDLDQLKNHFEPKVKKLLATRVLPVYGLTFTDRHEDQVEKLYIPKKTTMVTFNIPKFFKDGSDYRHSPTSDKLREDILKVMKDVAIELDFHVEFI